MIELNDIEKGALEMAFQSGCEFLANQSSWDVSTWSEEQMKGYVGAVVGGYVNVLVSKQCEIVRNT
jgi:hypothetical protein